MTMITPFAYQAGAAVTIANSSKPVYNAFEPGLGKSCVALLVARARRARRVLICCPLSAVYSWKLELRKFWPEHPPLTIINSVGDVHALAREGVFIVTYGLLSRSIDLVSWIAKAPRMDFSILDEAHALKNPKANRTRAVLAELKHRLGLVHLMSATPAPNHAGELWAVLRSLRPDLILNGEGHPMREHEFQARYCEKKTLRVNGRMIETIAGSKNVDELRARLKGFFLRETKKNVLKELPPLDFVTLPLQIPMPERFQTVGQLIESGEDDDDIIEHAKMMANSTRYKDLGVAKAPMVAEYVTDMLEGGVKQVVVWAVHHEVLDLSLLAVARVSGSPAWTAGSSLSSGPSRSRISLTAGCGSSLARSRQAGPRSPSLAGRFPVGTRCSPRPASRPATTSRRLAAFTVLASATRCCAASRPPPKLTTTGYRTSWRARAKTSPSFLKEPSKCP